jgi:hypothetical protein
MRNYASTAISILWDIVKTLDDHPDAFGVSIHKATGPLENPAPEIEEHPQVVAMESGERRPTFAEPVQTRAMIVPPEIRNMLGLYGGDVQANPMADEEPMLIVLKDQAVPRYSFVQWQEAQADGGIQDRLMYILHGEAVGEAPAIVMIHHCIPAGDFPV